MSNYQAQDSLVSNRQLKVQEVCIPFTITGSATAANVAPLNDEPALMFVRTSSVDQITPALDAGQSLPSFTSPNDGNGVFNVMVKINESIAKVCSVKLVSRTSTEILACDLAGTEGLDSASNKICANVDSAVDLSAANIDACLEIKYVAAQ